MVNRIGLSAVITALVISVTSLPLTVYALEGKLGCDDSEFLAINDLYFYDCKAIVTCDITASATITASSDLPPETITILKNAEVLQKVQANMARYTAGAAATGIPWQILATLHFREAGLNPTKSIADGETLKDGKSIDGAQMSADPNKDAVYAAQHFIGLVKGVYGIDFKTNQSLDAVANGFLAYNRGSMFKTAGATWQQSPYVMNYYDAQHIKMTWIHADSYNGSKKLNGLEGKTDGNVGALAVYKYLGGPLNGSPATNPTSTGGCGDSSGSATLVGDTAFPLVGDKTVVTNPEIFKNNTTDRAGHPYTAYDIYAKTGTPVVAFMSGKVTSIGHDKCGGTSVGVFNQESNKTITYMHLSSSLKVSGGDTVTLGGAIGNVGSAANGCGTMHLHIDAVNGSRRPSCKRENCPIENQKFFVDIGPQLYNTYQALSGTTGGSKKVAQ